MSRYTNRVYILLVSQIKILITSLAFMYRQFSTDISVYVYVTGKRVQLIEPMVKR